VATLEADELALIDRWWRAANYLTVGQIYLQENPLLREPLAAEHIKPRLLGHWGTSPGLNILWAHLNRVIVATGQQVLFVCGPGHGGPAILANDWLEGTWTQAYHDVPQTEAGLRTFFRRFSTPGGVPSHVSVTTPGSIHEGGELGYALVHAVGAAFDNPDLLVACVVGDGEAETGPMEASWKGLRFLNPARDGAVLPVLHLNGYKIANPTVLGRSSDEDVQAYLRAHGTDPHLVAGDDPAEVHEALAATLDACRERIGEIQVDARAKGAAAATRAAWPSIVLRTPKGWTGPHEVDGVQVEGTFRAHQVPLNEVRTNPEHLAQLEAWMHSYRPEELFTADGAPAPDLLPLRPPDELRMGASPHANGGSVLVTLDVPSKEEYAVPVTAPATERLESTRKLGELLRDVFEANEHQQNFRVFCPDELLSNRLGAVFDATERCWLDPILPTDDHLAPDGRVHEVLSEHLCQGWLEGYLLSGRHGLFATYEAFAMVSASMTIQHAKWLEHAAELPWRRSVASLNVLLTSTCWRNDHNGFSHQGPGLIDTVMSMRGAVARVYFPPDANCLLSVATHCLHSRNYVNLIVQDKQPQLQYLDADAARAHCSHGLGVWEWASTDGGEDPDIVLGCAGDIPTMETVAAAWLLQSHVPDLRVRVVNVVDLLRMSPADRHPHGLGAMDFEEVFTHDTEVVFAFHGYAGGIHEVLHGQHRPERFHVHGFQEQGTTTTPFDMVVLNQISRYHLVLDALTRIDRKHEGHDGLVDHCFEMLDRHARYVVEHLEDMPEITDWVWTDPRA
jgi:xylulose-5-phosphate/fructose-6-phosphate phosphoketolase